MKSGQFSLSVTAKLPPLAKGHTSAAVWSNSQSTNAHLGNTMGSLFGSAGSANLQRIRMRSLSCCVCQGGMLLSVQKDA